MGLTATTGSSEGGVKAASPKVRLLSLLVVAVQVDVRLGVMVPAPCGTTPVVTGKQPETDPCRTVMVLLYSLSLSLLSETESPVSTTILRVCVPALKRPIQ